MKKTPFLIVIAILVLMLCCACELPDGFGNGGLGGLGGGGNPSVGAFTVTASERIVYGYTDGQSITLGVDSPKAIDASKITYELTNGGNIATVDAQGVMTFTDYGAVTVKAKIGSKTSTNELTVYCSNLARAVLDKFHLAVERDGRVLDRLAACHVHVQFAAADCVGERSRSGQVRESEDVSRKVYSCVNRRPRRAVEVDLVAG